MSNGVSWNLQLAVREGQFEAARALMEEMVESTADESGTLVYEWYVSEDGKTCHINEGYEDSGAALAHVGNFGAKFAERFMGCFEPTGFFVYGEPSAEVRAALDTLGANYLLPFGGFRR